ncbi:hypothetical protein [Paludibaculum fermentans]|uniref:hypothetical protein n=1 Tax=Paludibaculum fermentans TaxID=1473598 RepID=UPI003EB8A7C4
MPISLSVVAGSRPVEDFAEPDLPWLPFAACLVAGLAAAALTAPRPQPMSDPAGWTLAKAVFTVAIAAGATALVARLTLPYFTACSDEQASRLAWRSAAIGVWFAPMAALATQQSLLALPVALVCGLAAGRLLRGSARLITEPAAARDDDPAPIFSAHYPSPLTRELAYAIAAAATLEFSAISAVGGQILGAAILSGVAASLMAASAPDTQAPEENGRAPLRFLLQAGLALVLACFALIPLPAFRAVKSRTVASLGHEMAGGPSGADLISGAILLADSRNAAKLTIPTPSGRAGSARPRATPPSVLPFSGLYWILSPPHRRPSASARVYHDSPISYSFTAGHHGFITMQAHQQLPAALDPRCCSALDVTVESADPQPQSVALEVLLTISELRKAPRQSLGVQRVDGTGESVLHFPIPARPTIDSFDRIIIDFHLGGRRFNQSANVAIRSFTFVPKAR